MGDCMVGWLGGWISGSMGGVSFKTLTILINFDLIEIIQFCLKIYDLLGHPHPWMGMLVGVGQWVNGWGQVEITNN